MRKLLLPFLFVILSISNIYAQNNVGIGTATPNANSILDLTSTTQGFLVPRMTTALRTAIATVAADEGLVVYDTDLTSFMYWDGAAWQTLSGGADADWVINTDTLYNNTHYVVVGGTSPVRDARMTILNNGERTAAAAASTGNGTDAIGFESYAGGAPGINAGFLSFAASGAATDTAIAFYGFTNGVGGGVSVGGRVQVDNAQSFAIGMSSEVVSTAGSNTGIFTAGEFHVNDNGTNNSLVGVEGVVNGSGTATSSVGIYGAATGATNNWAGFFQQGNVYIENNLGIGVLNPGVRLDVAGNVKFDDGTAAVGRVLTATDAFGNATWANLPAAPADGNGIYSGSGSLTGLTGVTYAGNNLIFSQGTGTTYFNLTLGQGDFNVQVNGATEFEVQSDGDVSMNGGTFHMDEGNANVGIGTSAPNAANMLEVAGVTQTEDLRVLNGAGNIGDVLTTVDATGLAVWAAPGAGAGAFATAANVTSNTPGDQINDDFVFGSPSLNDNTVASNDSRFFFDKSLGAFRAGTVTGLNWDLGNRGQNSFATGNNTRATGTNSTALGVITLASGQNSFAVGDNAQATNTTSFAAGWNTLSNGSASTVFGMNSRASGTRSFAAGEFIEANGNNSITFGRGATNANRLINNTTNSMMVGFNSDIPTLFVGQASGIGTIGTVGIGTSLTSATLDVVGTMQYQDGTQAAGRILTSDATGNATWQAPGAVVADVDWDGGGTGDMYAQNVNDQVSVGTLGAPWATIKANFRGNAVETVALSGEATDVGVLGIGVYGENITLGGFDGTGVYGLSNNADGWGYGGDFDGGYTGVRGRSIMGGNTGSQSFGGIFDADGQAGNGDRFGVFATANGTGGTGDKIGVYGEGRGSASGAGRMIGVYGTANGGSIGAGEWAGYFLGDVAITNDLYVTGNVSKGGGSFKVDHPLDPENKYLIHSFVESPDMMNIYNGNITTDGSGYATVTLPSYFDATNKEFRYQLTVIGTFAQAIVSEKVSGNTFKIQTNSPNVEVSWQVTGVRKDPWADAHRIEPEQEKEMSRKGMYIHPELYDQPAERGMYYVAPPKIEKTQKADKRNAKKASNIKKSQNSK